MYQFYKKPRLIRKEAERYGVTIVLVDTAYLPHGALQFSGEYRGSESVQKYLERKMNTYNEHSRIGY